MKFAKLSLAAIMAMSVSAFADVQNIKVSGDAKLYYSTSDAGNDDLFDQNNDKTQTGATAGVEGTAGQAAANIAISADLANGVAGKISFTMLSTLGLENNLVGNVWAGVAGANTIPDDALKTQWWANEAWIAKTLGKTTIKVGRQELDTPLAFSEKWNIVANSFDAAVVLNQDIPKTTLVAAWVGRGNGAGAGGVVRNAADGNDPYRTYGSAIDDTLTAVTGTPSNLASGAYAIAAITTAIPMTTAQAWYYDVVDIAHAYWLQADVTPMKGLTVGAQYAVISPTGTLDAVEDSSAWAAKVGYTMGDLSVSAAYSSTDKDGLVDIANTATGLNGSQSKLYTEAWWSYGYVSKPNTDAFTVTAEYGLKDIADLGVYYTHSEYGKDAKYATILGTNDIDMDEFTITASKKLGALDTTLAYIYTDADDMNNGDSFNTVQVYLTYNF